ncbi:unnamed protein product [Lactuca virosa]|uniref:Uncharacterized protein n=1 Tax=Lactuca virosa TaxID=75947 RepID=A0AAU9M9M3_9ASTR|nr:unnamed protein product [Lactuca virosa]
MPSPTSFRHITHDHHLTLNGWEVSSCLIDGRSCPATEPAKAIVLTSDPETVFDIKCFSRNQHHNRPPVRRIVLKKGDIVKAMKEKSFDVADFPTIYLTTTVEEEYNACGGCYCK